MKVNKTVETKRPLQRILPKLPIVLPDSVLQIPQAEVEENVQLRTCYICDARLTKGVRLVNKRFSSPNVGLPAKIVELMGDSFIVIATEEDLICPKCHGLFVHAERLERELEHVKKMLREYLMKKYCIEETQTGNASPVKKSSSKTKKDNGDLSTKNFSEVKVKSSNQTCTMCDFVCDSIRALKNHKLSAHLTNWICHFCNEVFEDETSFTNHTKIHLSESKNQANIKIFTCEICEGRFSNEEKFGEHLKLHQKTKQVFSCSMCDLQFVDESFYHDHIQGHEALNTLDTLVSLDKNDLALDNFEPNSDSVDMLDMDMFENAGPPLVEMSRFICATCETEYNSLEDMNEHFEAEHEVKLCTMCPDVAGTKEQIKAHMLEMHPTPAPTNELAVCENISEERICSQCGQKGATDESIVHLPDCFVVNPLYCDQCGTYADTAEILEFHKLTCFPPQQLNEELQESVDEHFEEFGIPTEDPANNKKRRPITCNACGERFDSKKLLSAHEKEFPDHLIIECPDCNQSFARERLLNEHREEAHNICHCRHCSKQFNNVKQLKAHENRHIRMSRSTFKCSVCEKVFQTHSGLRDHKAVHTGEFKYKCEFCGKGFVSRVRSEEHRACHTKEERYTCEICGLKFSVQGTYWIHRKWHDNPRPYECQECGMRYKHSSLLAVHKRKHTGERPYACPYCDQTFIVSNSLKRHMTLHTGSFPHSCSICNIGFPAKHKLAQHMSKVHNDNNLLIEQVSKKNRDLKVALKETTTSPSIENMGTWVKLESSFTPGEYLTIETEQGQQILIPQGIVQENDHILLQSENQPITFPQIEP